jgi:hypothetical protein
VSVGVRACVRVPMECVDVWVSRPECACECACECGCECGWTVHLGSERVSKNACVTVTHRVIVIFAHSD